MKSQDKIAEIKFFNRFNREGGYDVFDKTGYQKIIKILKAEIPLKKGLLILDMGCGSGKFTSYLTKAYPNSRVIGIDISKGCVLQAKKDFPQIEFKTDDVEKTKFDNETFDIVWYSGILHHFPDFRKVAAEACRVLKPKGRFFSYDPNLFNPPFWLYRHPKSPFYSSVGIISNERLLAAREVKRIFSSSGFAAGTFSISGIPFTYVESKEAQALLGIYNLFDRLLGMTPFAKFFGALVIGFGSKK